MGLFLARNESIGIFVMIVFYRILTVHTSFHSRSSKLSRTFWSNRLSSSSRIGPHNQDILSVIVGNLLGDAYIEHRNNSTRIILHLGSRNREYIAWLHEFYYSRGYCSNNPLKVLTQIGKGGKVYFSTKIRTYSFQSFNWLFELFTQSQKSRKRVPDCIENLLTPLALAVWIMDDGTRSGSGLLLCTDGFLKKEVEMLQKALSSRYEMETTIRFSPASTKEKLKLQGSQDHARYRIYIPKSNIKKLREIVTPWIHPSMMYKIPTNEINN